MSPSLYWRPATEGERLGDQLKHAVSPDLFGHDGNCTSDWVTVDAEFVPFLRDAAATAVGRNWDLRLEAEDLIRLIEQYGSVQLRTSR